VANHIQAKKEEIAQGLIVEPEEVTQVEDENA